MIVFFNFALINLQNDSDDIDITFRLNAIIAPAVFGCCDFIAQFILVRTSNNSLPFSLFI